MLSVVSGAVLLGFQYALLALGVYISFRILNIPDLTVDGSFTFGIAVSAVLCASGHPFFGLTAAVFAGFAAGIVTGFLQTKAKIHPILAGILTMSGLYTVNITVMGAPNVSLIGKKRFYDGFASLFGENSSGDLPTAALDPLTAEKVLDITQRIVAENSITTMMITHNIKSALKLGTRTIMLECGKSVLDLKGDERNNMTVQDLLGLYRQKSGKELDNDRMLLTGE